MNTRIAWLALLLQVAPAQRPVQPPAKATIEGTVVRAGTSDPVSGVRVTLTRPAEPRPAGIPAQTRPPATLPSTTTDAQGKFVLKDIDAGSYGMVFAANGYVRQEYGQKLFPGQGTLIDITAGQNVKGLVISMTRTANLSGRVFDAGKHPVAAVHVHAMRFTYDATGRRLVQPAGSTQTDDRGEYRLYFLTPGKYYLAAGMLREAQPARAFNGLMDSYPVTYYPGTADVGQATAIDVRAGAELNMDVAMTNQPLFRIRGKVIDTRTGQSPSSVLISLTPRGASSAAAYEVRGDALSYNPADGTYEVRDVLPGSYLLTASWGDSINVTASQMPAFGMAPMTPQQPIAQSRDVFPIVREGVAYAPVSVGNSNVENLALSIMPGGTVSGRLRFDNPPASTSGQAPAIRLEGNNPILFTPAALAVNSDGTFTIRNMKAGEYRVQITGLPNGYYVKEARVGASDALNRPFQFNPADNAPLEIVVGAGATSIIGTAANERGERMPGALVALVPERARDRIDLYADRVMREQQFRTLRHKDFVDG